MRQLSEAELKSVQKAIIIKEIAVLELLAEVYDHYLTHLERFPEDEFSLELSQLESKWSYDYCQKIQKEFKKNMISSIRSLQWRLLKTYFSWPKMMITIMLFSAAYFCTTLIPTTIYFFGIIIPILVLLIGYSITMSYRSNRKFRKLKSIFNFKSTGLLLTSGESSYLFSNSIFPINLFSVFILAPKNLGLIDDFSNPWITNTILIFSFSLFLHTLTIREAWKIKTKSTLE